MFDKTVHHFLMTATGGSVADHDGEYDQVEWFPAAEALRIMTHRNEAQVVERALQMIDEQRAAR